MSFTSGKDIVDGVKKLSVFLVICAHCKKIRDDKGYWNQMACYIRDYEESEFSCSVCSECVREHYPHFIECYMRDHTETEFSHGICPECAKELYPNLF